MKRKIELVKFENNTYGLRRKFFFWWEYKSRCSNHWWIGINDVDEFCQFESKEAALSEIKNLLSPRGYLKVEVLDKFYVS